MAGSADPSYNQNMQAYPVPDQDNPQPMPNIDWAANAPGELNALADALTGNPVAPGQPFIRVISPGGAQIDLPDGTVGVPGQ